MRTEIPDVLIIEPKVFSDERGFFFESFNEKAWREATGVEARFVQDNHSRSTKGVLRGLHYQLPPVAQGKLVRCVVGEVFDVAVDLRKHSPTFRQWVGESLSADNKKQIWIPQGFAHGFLVISDVAEVVYKTTDYYAAKLDRGIRWNDPELDLDWPCKADPVLSEKDANAPFLNRAEVFDLGD
jgi:dTDP-4-dehydrorhamnose 3,5-epimerase